MIVKKSLLILSLIIFANTLFCQTTDRKILFIGIDGCRWDALQAADAPAIDNLLNNAVYSGNGLTEYPTWSGTGWSNMLTGVFHPKHGVSDNSFAGSNFTQYPDFLTRAEMYDPGLSTFSVVHWSPINTTIIQAVDNEITVETDFEVKNNAVEILNNEDPDILFVAFDDVDHTGHSFGFSPLIPEYIETIELTAEYVGEIVSALEDRANFANEDWLIVLTTDHGGTPSGHGGGTLDERTIFHIFNNPAFVAQNLTRTVIDISTNYNEANFAAGTYAQPIDQSPFLFGSTQDFTIELWVKSASFTQDPALISNKDWNSGINEGFVISAQQGEFWKVNVGDGTNRIDIQGGYLDPENWHHIAVSFDRDGLMTAYEDGAVVGFEWMQDIGDINSSLPLTINQDGTTSYNLDFDGSYRDIRIWNTVIPDSVIVDWATLPITISHPFYNNLVANWMCDEGGGSQLNDMSVNSNHCTIVGPINWNLDQSNNFTVYDYSDTPRQPDNATTALNWLCIPIEESWNLDGKIWTATCQFNSVAENKEKNDFSISPNPAERFTSIKFDAPLKQNTTIKLFDAEGRKLFEKQLYTGMDQYKILLTGYEPGVYLVTLQNEHHLESAKLVIE